MSSEENMDISNTENIAEQPADTEAPGDVSDAIKVKTFWMFTFRRLDNIQANQQ